MKMDIVSLFVYQMTFDKEVLNLEMLLMAASMVLSCPFKGNTIKRRFSPYITEVINQGMPVVMFDH
jgi:hypothetical protein